QRLAVREGSEIALDFFFQTAGPDADRELAEFLSQRLPSRGRAGRRERPHRPIAVSPIALDEWVARCSMRAARLFLSVRTVERHLSNAYKKVGVEGKTARVGARSRPSTASSEPQLRVEDGCWHGSHGRSASLAYDSSRRARGGANGSVGGKPRLRGEGVGGESDSGRGR